ncbi:MAG: glycosyltransferase family 4 protein [Mycobacterium sp.]|nr:glycosyltransferase family 4 protein [Mycobacterium sp.]
MPESAASSAGRTGTGRRVLWVSTSLDTRGGVASYVRTMRETALWNQWRIRHVATHCDGSRTRRILIFVRALPALLAEVLRRPAIVHVHMSSYGSFFRKSVVVWLCALLQLPVVLQVHGGEFHRFHAAAPVPLQWYIRRTVESAAVVIALGARWQRRRQELAPKADVVAVPNGIRLAAPVPQPAPEEPVRVLFLGQISEGKGTFDLLDAWSAAFGAADSVAQLTIAGDGELDRARRRVAELGLGASVHLPGWVSGPEVEALLCRSHVLVLPSHNEGQPMAILEAMAHGLCVVATDTGGIPDLIGDGCGLLVRVGEPSELAEALTRVVTRPDLRVELSGKAIQRAREQFDVTVVADRIDQLYRAVLR